MEVTKPETEECKKHELRPYFSDWLHTKYKCTNCEYETIKFNNQFPDVQ